ncbi:probable galactose-1-phosphate uridylyltransferase [Hyposmocoma kahamanoa]|uniref:probable galactose-1-phosphate uridylyltransferase n=1 Tax=Hyposmocoma kahamanoa TaxID=1477025 RepID=UPI000E6D8675|nr:probable galactose-1-phosphate uridylyltransferase [Hyposmocoma kahamanoa]
MEFKPTEHQHVRYNPLKDEWILVSPHRCLRPWSGQTEPSEENQPPDPKNPLKAGALRANGQRNPIYTSTYVFPNDFPALLEKVPEPPVSEHPLFQAAAAKGTCRVMCFHPDSTMTVPLMSVDEILAVIEECRDKFHSGPHLHYEKKKAQGHTKDNGKGYARSFKRVRETRVTDIAQRIAKLNGSGQGTLLAEQMADRRRHKLEQMVECGLKMLLRKVFGLIITLIYYRTQMEYYTKHRKAMLVDYLEQELEKKERIVIENNHWVALVPYWAIWPFETMLLPKTGAPQRLTDLSNDQKRDLAEIMKLLNTKYDNLFNCSFPYSMGWHGAPTGPNTVPGDSPHWLLHALYLPPLLRSAAVKKFMVGYEMLAQYQRDLTPEQAAARLRECDHLIHYTVKK